MKRCGHPTRAGHPCSIPLSQGLDRCTVHADDALTRMGVQAACLARREQVAVWRCRSTASTTGGAAAVTSHRILVTVPHVRVTQRAPAGIRRWGARQLTCEVRPSRRMRNGEWFWTVAPFMPIATVFDLAVDEALVLADRLLAVGHDTDAHRIIKAATGVDVEPVPVHPPEPKPAKPTPWTRDQMLLFSRSEGWPP